MARPFIETCGSECIPGNMGIDRLELRLLKPSFPMHNLTVCGILEELLTSLDDITHRSDLVASYGLDQ